ncbi:hypothetical protein K435DRAFT_762643 [Dendrothele bispora CBS 962.96]|uniref:MARVEL domain-containing protein n=1 Tax=Dendrothele bispora (strain CBS 962.96) TaxID=1314807 RepID=A0A4S8LEJ9_DENBC|nr:hypothetical protein K435DRAFT_762643 [Dendrothele bispora CBS 962.96]
MSVTTAPLKVPRLVALFFSFAWGVIAAGVSISADVKSNQQKSLLQQLIPQGTSLDLDTSDVFSTGTVITVVSLLIAVLSLTYLVLLLFVPATSTRTLPIQWISLTFLAVWLFAVQIPFTVFFANRSAGVRVFAGNVQVPDSIVQPLENSFGVTPVYRHIDYLRLVAILPWFTFLFTTIAAIVSFSASRRRASYGGEKA